MCQPLPDTSHNNETTNYHNKISLQIVTTDCYNKSELNKLHFISFYLIPPWYTVQLYINEMLFI